MSATISLTSSSRIHSIRWSKITLRWSFITLSNLSRFLRMSKLRLHLLLRLLQRLVDPGVHDRLVLLEAQPLQHGVELVGPEDAHEVVFQRQEELGMPGIALPPGAPAQLVVDPPALVPFGAEHVKPAGRDS